MKYRQRDNMVIHNIVSLLAKCVKYNEHWDLNELLADFRLSLYNSLTSSYIMINYPMTSPDVMRINGCRYFSTKFLHKTVLCKKLVAKIKAIYTSNQFKVISDRIDKDAKCGCWH